MSELDWYLTVNLKARQLRLLVAISDFRTLREAAANAHLTVPAVSKALSEIESSLDVKLFDRTGHGLRPTAFGECAVRHARAALASLHQAAEEIQSLKAGGAGKLHIGALHSLISTLIPKALARFKSESPSTNISVIDGRMSGLLLELRRGNLDVIVGRLPNASDMIGLHEQVLSTTPLTIVVGRRHPLAAMKDVAWSDLMGFPWVLPPIGTLLRAPVENTFASNGLPMPSDYIETISTQLTRAYLKETHAIAVQTIDPVNPYPNDDDIVVLPLQIPLMTRPLGVVWRADKPVSPSVDHLLRCLEAVCGHAAPLSDATVSSQRGALAAAPSRH